MSKTFGIISLYFSKEEMELALERIGYIIKEEELIEEKHRGHYFEEVKRRVTNVYHPNSPTPMAPYHFNHPDGSVEYVFTQELKSRMLRMFK
jgi:hypothetical protein